MFSSTPLTVLVTIPTADRDFEAYVRQTYSDGSTPTTFEALIRADYPLAAVRVRALSGELFTVWYIYRDGRWQPPGHEDDGRGGTTRVRREPQRPEDAQEPDRGEDRTR